MPGWTEGWEAGRPAGASLLLDTMLLPGPNSAVLPGVTCTPANHRSRANCHRYNVRVLPPHPCLLQWPTLTSPGPRAPMPLCPTPSTAPPPPQPRPTCKEVNRAAVALALISNGHVGECQVAGAAQTQRRTHEQHVQHPRVLGVCGCNRQVPGGVQSGPVSRGQGRRVGGGSSRLWCRERASAWRGGQKAAL
jgi:hypothetical protein